MTGEKVRFRHYRDGRWRWGMMECSDSGLRLGYRDDNGEFYAYGECEELGDVDLCGFRDSVFLHAVSGLSSNGSLRADEVVNKANSIAEAAMRCVLGE